MGIVAGMHVAVIFLIARSLGIVPPLLHSGPLVLTPVDPPPIVDEDPVPISDPRIVEPPITVPIPDDPPPESPSQETAIAALPIDPNAGTPVSSGTAEIRGLIVSARQDARHPLSQPRYPSPDIREGNEGNADVEVYVLPNGRVGDARIARSSGFERLDQSAIEEAKRNWRLVPATRDGVPFAQWYKVRVTFKLTNAR